MVFCHAATRDLRSPPFHGRFRSSHSPPEKHCFRRGLLGKALADDKVRPNSIGAEVTAQLSFETLPRHDGLEVPAWSRRGMESAIGGEPLGLWGERDLFGRLLETWNTSPQAQAP